jgi:hypothetical protein
MTGRASNKNGTFCRDASNLSNLGFNDGTNTKNPLW